MARCCRRSTATTSRRPIRRTGKPKLLHRIFRPEGRRLDRLRLLDLQRRLPGTGPQPGPRRKISDNPVQPDWGFAWPHNRRIMYNRASADPEGRPWSERKKYIWWDQEKKWVGDDEPDFEPDKPPDYRPAAGAKGMDAIAGDRAVHHEAGRPRPGCSRPAASRTGRSRRTTSRSNRRWATCSIPSRHDNPTTRYFDGPLNPLAHDADGGVPGRRLHVPADRALPERPDEPVQ